MLLFLMVAPLIFDRVAVSLLCQILIFGLLAMSLDLIFGYTGMWSFCHAAIFGVAGYTVLVVGTGGSLHGGSNQFDLWTRNPSSKDGLFPAHHLCSRSIGL
jgi:ABC-type branched-subunit amino acid transport system permease subunit